MKARVKICGIRTAQDDLDDCYPVVYARLINPALPLPKITSYDSSQSLTSSESEELGNDTPKLVREEFWDYFTQQNWQRILES